MRGVNTSLRVAIFGLLMTMASLSLADDRETTFFEPPIVTATKLPDGKTHIITQTSGYAATNNKESLFYRTRTTCRITIVNSADGETVVFEYMICDAVDFDGDMFFMYGKAEPGASVVLSIVGGTGKFEGIAGEIQTNGSNREWAGGAGEYPYEVLRVDIPGDTD